MPQPLDLVLAEIRELLLDPTLTRAIAAGRRRGATPSVKRAELRPVALKSGIHLQIVTDDGSRPYTRNEPYGERAAAAVDALLTEPFSNWHVETPDTTVQVRVTKKGDAQVHRTGRPAPAPATTNTPATATAIATAPTTPATATANTSVTATAPTTPATATATAPATAHTAATATTPTRPATAPAAAATAPATATATATASITGTGTAAGTATAAAAPHDRAKRWLLDPGDPLFRVVGGTAAKRRQVDAFLRSLAATLPADPSDWPSPLRVVDLGCGNAYLTFAAYRHLTDRGATVHVVGVDVREDQRVRNSAVAAELGCADDVRFVAGTIEDAQIDFEPHLVLALHACDTATDQALARAVRWNARWVLAAPCCHHDIAAQLKGHHAPAPYGEVTRSAILRERFADVLTDTLRASLLRATGYKVDVVEFVDSAHTPRNLLLRARRTGIPGPRDEYDALTAEWGVMPALEKLLT